MCGFIVLGICWTLAAAIWKLSMGQHLDLWVLAPWLLGVAVETGVYLYSMIDISKPQKKKTK